MTRRIARIVIGVALVLVLTLGTAECTLRTFALFTSVGLPPIFEVVEKNEAIEIAVYGDSTPFGLGAETSFPEEISHALGVRVVNRSRPALNSAQVAMVLQDDLAHYDPHVVLVMAGINDCWNLQEFPGALLGPAARWYQRLPRLRLARLLGIWWEAGIGAGGLDTRELWRDRRDTARLLSNSDLRRLLENSYARFDSLTTGVGARVLFLGYPSEGWNGVGTVAEEVLRERYGDRFLSLRELFDGHPELLQDDRFHPKTQGQKIIAEAIVRELRRRGWSEPANDPL